MTVISQSFRHFRLGFDATQMGIAFGIAAAMIWGANQAFARLGVIQGLTPFDIAALRFGVAAVLLAPHFFAGGAFARVGLARSLILAGLIGPGFFVLNVAGYTFAPLAHGALILPATFVVAGLALAAIVTRQAPASKQVVGAATIIGGLVLTSGVGVASGVHAQAWIGDAMFAFAALLWAGATVLGSRWSLRPLDIAAAVAVVSGLAYVPFYLALTQGAALTAAPAAVLAPQILVHGVLAGVGAVFAFTRSVQILGPSRASVFPALVPAFAIAIGLGVFDEVPSVVQWVGLGIVMLGLLVAVGALPSRRR